MKQKQAYPYTPVISHEDELILMALIASGDKGAFATVMDRHLTSIFRFAFSIVGDKSAAEDITQETCLRLWENAERWQPSGRVRGWLLRIAHNLCMDALRAAKPHAQLGDYEHILPSAEAGPRAVLQMREISERMDGALFRLPERQRTALMLVYYAECSQNEAAIVMGISVDALESLVARGKRSLKATLPELNDLLEEG